MSETPMPPDDGEELDVSAAELGFLLTPVSPPAADATRARLLARASADNAAAGVRRGAPDSASALASAGAQTGPGAGAGPGVAARAGASSSPPPLSRGLLMPRWAMGLAMIVPAAALVMIMQTRDELETVRRTFASAERGRAHALDSLTARLTERDAQVAALTGERVSVVNLADAKSQQPMGRMFWDQATDRWTFTAHHLPMPAKGRTYQLWLVVAGQKVSVGTFLPSAGGDAEVRQTFAVKPGTLQAVAVTDEPTGGMPQPTGPMVVLGKAAQ